MNKSFMKSFYKLAILFLSGQALCNHCRENTHRAKMFSTHEVVHMSKCLKEGHRRVSLVLYACPYVEMYLNIYQSIRLS